MERATEVLGAESWLVGMVLTSERATMDSASRLGSASRLRAEEVGRGSGQKFAGNAGARWVVWHVCEEQVVERVRRR